MADDHTGVVEQHSLEETLQRFRTRLTFWVALVACAALAATTVADLAGPGLSPGHLASRVLALVVALAVLYAASRGRLRSAGLVLPTCVLLIVTAAAVSNGGYIAPNFVWYGIGIVLAAWLHGTRAAAAFTVLTIAVILGITWMETLNWLPPRVDYGRFRIVVPAIFALGALGVVAHFAGRDLELRLKAQRAANHRLAEQSAVLAESEERYRGLFETLPVPVYVRDRDTYEILAVNRVMAELYGYTREEFSRMKVADLVDPAERDAYLEEIRLRTPGRGTAQTSRIHVARDGRRIEIAATSMPIAYVGRAARLVVARDVSAERAAQRAAREANERLVIAMESLDEAVALYDADDRFVFVNHCFRERNAGLEDMTAPGVRFEDYMRAAIERGYRPQAAGREEAWLAERMAEHRNPHGPREMQHRDGSWRLVTEQRLPGGETITFAFDITEKKLAEQAVIESEARLRSMFHDSPAAQSLTDAASGGYVDVNHAWCELTGYTREEAAGRSSLDIGLRDAAARARLRDAVQHDGGVDALEESIRRRDGATRTCLTSARLLQIGSRRLMLGWMIDITEQRRAQRLIEDMNVTLESQVAQRTAELSGAIERLQASQEALLRSEKLAALGRLVAGVAHELNTPIGNSLLSASTFAEHTEAFASQATAGGLRRSALDTYVAHSREAAAILLRNLHKAADLIVSFKQVSADQTSSQRRSFELDRVVEECLIAHRPTLRKTPITVSAAVPAGIRMDSYPGPLGQVIANLIHNAVIHGHEHAEGGVVEIRARQSGPSAELIVRDDGCGIAEDDLKRVFDPFFTTKMGRGGTGLGLPICHRIVTGILGGTITVESRHGKGTTVSLLLPLSAPTGDTPEAPAARAA